ncbi:MAG: single-stranded-DNA-specific exonuclease RecJ [Clostridia bacterium]|nr:single-stranded-DNA-specific exonuclease RecJ [Clostridia bacterium]
MTKREWQISEIDDALCEKISKECKLSPLTAKILINRGLYTKEEIEVFLNKDSIPLYDPFLLKDMDKAVERITQAIEKKQRICIYGDYDVDGVTSTVMLYLYLCSRGVECEYFIPERISEGYGLSLPVIDKMKGKVDLIITVDTGVTAVAEAEYAKSIGIDMVVTDHHSCREVMPDAVAVVNPHREDSEYPFRNLAGVGVVFKLLCALEGSTERILELYSDIIAVGTVADVMPIIGENRRIIGIGLQKLAETENLGLLALMRRAGIVKYGKKVKKITSATVGYVLAPRINAAGRIACASRAVELLLATDSQEADVIAEELCEINKLRQVTEQTIYEQAVELIEQSYLDDRFLVLAYDGWHQGVIGVVASKIAERYSRPCILFSLDGDIAKGSGRSIKGFSLMDALSSCGGLLVEYGGHELAAGLSIETSKIDEFRKKINEYASQLLDSTDCAVPLEIECEAKFSELTEKGIDEILRLEPFGLSNPQPILVLRNVTLHDIIPLSQGKHVRFRITGSENERGYSLNAVYFGMPFDNFDYCEGDKCDVVFSVDINEYMGSRSPQLFVKEIKLACGEQESIDTCNQHFDMLLSGKYYENAEHDIPDLSDFRNIFRYIRRETGHEGRVVSLTSAVKTLRHDFDIDVTLCKFRVILEVLNEQKLISLTYREGGNTAFLKMMPSSGKINIDESPLLCAIRSGGKGKNNA